MVSPHPPLQQRTQGLTKNVSAMTLTLSTHYFPAVTEFPLISLAWPMTSEKDFWKTHARTHTHTDTFSQEVFNKQTKKGKASFRCDHRERVTRLFSFLSIWPHLSLHELFCSKANPDLIRRVDAAPRRVDGPLKSGILTCQRSNTPIIFIYSSNSYLDVKNAW